MSDVFEELGRLGLRASKSQVEALLTDATTSRLSPVQVIERLVEVERRERDTRNFSARRCSSRTRRPPRSRRD